ncbi:hypothetical protein GGI07_003332 [Coemansia sp. Benny D115]|nr:hypothetical protein GGI07_003332 [Coemansia sp. Benny D115]
MEESNIVAIPRHPPLPRTVSGVFQGAEPPFVSTQSSKGQAPSREPSGYVPSYSNQQQSHQFQAQQQQQQQQHVHVGSNGTESHARSTYRPRSKTGYAPPNGSSAAPYDDQYNYPHHQTSSAAHLVRRDSAASVTLMSMANENTHAQYPYQNVPASNTYHSNMPLANMPMLESGQERRRSIGSVNSDRNSVDKNSNGGGERKYACDWPGCDQAFDRVEHLNRHKRRHTGDKPYRCLVSTCDKLFSRFDNMMQHVGIHCSEGKKTDIPNIKNLNSRCNGRGRVRRTSYRGTQDSYEKFRRHVEASLGPALAECCVLPTKNLDFSNLTLRPLINDPMPTPISEETPLCKSISGLSTSPQSTARNIKRPRCDSVVDGMEKYTHGGQHRQSYSPLSDSSCTLSTPTTDRYNTSGQQQLQRPQQQQQPQMEHRSMYPSLSKHTSPQPVVSMGADSNMHYDNQRVLVHRSSFPAISTHYPQHDSKNETSYFNRHRGSVGTFSSSVDTTSNMRAKTQYHH